VTGLLTGVRPGSPRASLGAADCEAVSEGFLAQPVAALSSLAFVGAAVWLARRRPAAGPERRAATAYAGLLGLVGLGSVAYHGPQWQGAELLHDGPIALVVAMGAVVPLARRLRGRPAVAPGTAGFVRAAGAAAAAGLGAYALGRTGGPACDPASLLQPHAAWHTLMAVALGSWGAALWAPTVAAGPPPPGLRSTVIGGK
jgi:hypothetical protein